MTDDQKKKLKAPVDKPKTPSLETEVVIEPGGRVVFLHATETMLEIARKLNPKDSRLAKQKLRPKPPSPADGEQ